MSGRRTGRTYRMLLKALIAATDNASYSIAIAVPNHAVALNCMEMLGAMTRPLQGFAKLQFTQETVTFDNGSAIHFYMPEQPILGEIINWLGIDESFYSLATGERSYRWLKELQGIENRYKVQGRVDPAGSA